MSIRITGPEDPNQVSCCTAMTSLVFSVSDGDGEARNSYCLCGQKKQDCSNPLIVPVVAEDRRWVVLPVFCEEMVLIRRMVGLDILIEYREFWQDVRMESGSCKCPECDDVFGNDDDFVDHLRSEKNSLEEMKEMLLRARQQQDGECFLILVVRKVVEIDCCFL